MRPDVSGPESSTTVRHRISGRAVVLFCAAAGALVSLTWLRDARDGRADPSTYWDDAVRRDIQAIVESRYVDPIGDAEARRLFDEAMRGYVEALDPYSRYVPAEDRPALEQETAGSFGGIGVLVATAPGGLRVTGVRDLGPAARAGIVPGEILESADGNALSGRDREELLRFLKGPVGTHVSIVVRALDGTPRTVAVERAQVALDTVPSVRLLPGSPAIGYVRIEQFSDSTIADVREAIADLRRDGAGAYVLDLRQNLGGVVRAAEAVASLFLPDGTLVCTTRRRDGAEEHRTRAEQVAPDVASPLAILVDESTASASEILAGALQDHGRGVLVGERTYGKFYVQTLVPTATSGAVVRLTTSRYETPSGRVLQRDEARGVAGGLLPDVHAAIPSREARAMLQLTFASQSGPHWRTLPRGSEAEAMDAQLAAAVSLLRGGQPPAALPGRRS